MQPMVGVGDGPQPYRSESVGMRNAAPSTACGALCIEDVLELKHGLVEVLRRIGGECKDVCKGDLAVERLGAANTNHVFLVCHNSGWKAILRLYGPSGGLFSREKELETFRKLAGKGMGPRLLLEFENGRVEEYLEGPKLEPLDIRRPQISKLVASAMRHFHESFSVEEKDKRSSWDRLRSWHEIVVGMLDGVEGMSKEERKEILGLGHDIDLIERRLTQLPFGDEFCLCHNDVHYANMVMLQEGECLTIKLIDYEYALPNTPAFDIGNHWNEWCSDFESVETMDFTLFPELDERLEFVRNYLEQGAGETIDGHAIGQLEAAANRFSVVSHLMWGLWAIIQSCTSTIEDGLDFVNYARLRLGEYKRRRVEVVGK